MQLSINCSNLFFSKVSGARQMKNQEPYSPWVVQSQLTPVASDIPKPHKSLRAYATESNSLNIFQE